MESNCLYTKIDIFVYLTTLSTLVIGDSSISGRLRNDPVNKNDQTIASNAAAIELCH